MRTIHKILSESRENEKNKTTTRKDHQIFDSQTNCWGRSCSHRGLPFLNVVYFPVDKVQANEVSGSHSVHYRYLAEQELLSLKKP